jgi:hypothetical protein
LDSEYTLVVDVIDVMASAKSRTLFAAAGTPAFSAGAANLYGCHVSPVQVVQTTGEQTVVDRSAE